MTLKRLILPSLLGAAMTAALGSCTDNAETPADILESIPANVQVLWAPDSVTATAWADMAEKATPYVAMRGAVRFVDADGREWTVYRVKDSEALLKHLDDICESGEGEDQDAIRTYKSGHHTYMYRGLQLWITDTKAESDDLEDLLESADKSNVRGVKVVSDAYDGLSTDSVLVASGAWSETLLLPSDAWIVGRGAIEGGDLTLTGHAYRPSGDEVTPLTPLTPIDEATLGMLSGGYDMTVAAGCRDLDWDTLLARVKGRLGVVEQIALKQIEPYLKRVNGTVACGASFAAGSRVPDRYMAVMQMSADDAEQTAKAIREMVDRYGNMLPSELQGRIHCHVVGGHLVISSEATYNGGSGRSKLRLSADEVLAVDGMKCHVNVNRDRVNIRVAMAMLH